MGLTPLLYACTLIVFIIQALFSPLPLGNDRAQLKRVPIVTIAIILINVAIFAVTGQATELQDRKLSESALELISFCQHNTSFLLFENEQKKLSDAGLLQDHNLKVLGYSHQLNAPDNDDAERSVSGTSKELLDNQFDTLLTTFKQAKENHVFYHYGIAPEGHWKPYQLLTSMFLHGDLGHVAGNMIVFGALAIALEALWGRTIFLAFYILVGLCACIPGLIVPFSGPMIGASGAISGVMGAFLVSLHKTKLKIGWISLPLFWIFIAFKKKPFGIVRLPAYVFLPYFFTSQLLLWWFFKQLKATSGVAHSVHVGGFFFGVFFAVILEYVNLKTNFFDLKYSESLVSAEFQELSDIGQFALAEQRIGAFLQRHPDDLEAQASLAEVYQKLGKYGQMNDVYSGIIRRHLAEGNKQDALYAYDQLLSGFPDNQIRPRIQPNDWMTICDYLQKQGMGREAGVEYERMADCLPDSPLALRACVQGGEAALAAGDRDRARRLFQRALTVNPNPAHEPRIRRGIERCDAHP